MDRARFDALLEQLCQGTRAILGDKMKSLYLYGSYARGDFDAFSDLDLMALVDLRDEVQIGQLQAEVDALASDLGLEYDVLISLSVYSAGMVLNNAEVVPFYRNVLSEGVDLIA